MAMGLATGRSPFSVRGSMAGRRDVAISHVRGSMAGRRDVAISHAGAIGAVVFGFRIDGRW